MRRIVTGTGSYLPAREVSNTELAALVTNFDARRAGCDLHAWIRRHFGVRSRRWARDDESTGDMALAAARRALEAAALEPSALDLIVLATATSDHVAPHSVSFVQAELGTRAVCHQLQDACPGFLNALMVADSLMANLGYRRALVVAAEKMTHLVDKRDFRTAGLFADAAGAVVLESLELPEHAPGRPYGFLSFYAGTDGAAGDALRVPAGGTRRPLDAARLAAGEQYLVSDFSRVYAFAVETTRRCIAEAVARAGLRAADVDWLIPHHASENIVRESLATTGIAPERLLWSIAHTGNTSSASVPTALDEAVRAGRLRDGEHVALVALGGGMGWGSTVYRWIDPARARAARR